MSIVGNMGMALAFLFIGHMPSLNVGTPFQGVLGMVSLIGLGYGLVMVSSFGRSHLAAMNLGFKDDISTYLMISGKILSVTCICSVLQHRAKALTEMICFLP